MSRRPLARRWRGLWVSGIAMVVSLVGGWILFRGSLGWGDSIYQLALPRGIAEYLVLWAAEQNGRLGQGLLAATLLLPLRWISTAPETYPWWLIRGAAMFCVTAAPIYLLAAMPGVRQIRTPRLAVAAVALWASWSVNPVTFETSAWFTAVELIGYSLPICLISLAVLCLYTVPAESLRQRSFLIALAVVGFFFALVGEQYLLAFPVLVLGSLVFRWLSGQLPFRDGALLWSSAVAGTMAGFLVYWQVPAQAIRARAVGADPTLTLGKLWRTYQASGLLGFGFVSPFHDPLRPPEITTAAHLLLMLVHTLLILAVVVLVVVDLRRSRRPGLSPPYGASTFLLTLLIAYHACFATLLVSGYLPTYSIMFPGLLLAMFLVGTVLLLAPWVQRFADRRRWGAFVSLIGPALLAARG